MKTSIIFLKIVSIFTLYYSVPSLSTIIKYDDKLLSYIFIFFFITIGYFGISFISKRVIPKYIEDKSENELIEMINEEDIETRKDALTIIEQESKFHTTGFLIPLLKDEEKIIRIRVINLIEQIGDNKFTSYLIPMLEDSDISVRINAAKALATLGDQNVIEKLEKAKLYVHKDFRIYFDEAISKIENKK